MSLQVRGLAKWPFRTYFFDFCPTFKSRFAGSICLALPVARGLEAGDPASRVRQIAASPEWLRYPDPDCLLLQL